MEPGHRAAVGLALAGAGILVGTTLAAALFGFEAWLSAGVVTALGLLVAGAGAAGLHYGHGHGTAALAAGLVLAGLGAVMNVGFALAWGQGTLPYLAGVVLLVVGMAQAAWFAVLGWAVPGPAARWEAGLRLGLGTGALAMLLILGSEFVSASPEFIPGEALSVLGLALAASGRGLAGRGTARSAPAARARDQG